MFGSNNPFGQSSSSPFGSQSVFGQSSSVNTNPFATKPFGSPNPNPNPFGSQSGGSLFGGSSTGVFGQTALSVGSTPTFGASSAPAFGSSTPAFGASSTPAFGSSAFGQKPAFGGFGSTQNQGSPFGSTFQQTQPAFGSNLFGSTQFGASSQPAFGAGSTPAFGSASTPAFGATTTPTFGATNTPLFGSSTTPAFGGTTTPAFGSTTTSLFGSTGAGFGVSSTPAFGSSVTPAFGAPSTSLFGSSSTPAFGASSTPAFGSSSAPAFGSSTSPSFGFGSSPSFGQSTPTFGSTPFGSTPSPFGTQSSPFGAQTPPQPFGSTGFGQHGGQSGGSRVAAYTPTPDADGNSGTQSGKLESISAMPVYKDKSHEELRWEDYQRGDKGGPNPSAQPAVVTSFPAQTQPNPFSSTSVFAPPSTNPFSTQSSNPFGSKPSPFAPSTISSLPTNPLSSFSSSSPFNTSMTQVFGTPTNPGFPLVSSSPSPFAGTTNNATSSTPFSSVPFASTQSSGLFQSTTPSIGQTQSIFGQQPTIFPTNSTGFGTNLFGTPASQFSGPMTSILTASNPAGFGQAMPSISNTFQYPAPAQTSNTFNPSNFGQTQSAFSGGFSVTPNTFNQSSFLQLTSTPSNMAPITNPFGTLPAMPQMSIGRVGTTPSVQYGISSMPVAEQPTPIRISSLLAPRHLSQRRMRLPARKYHPKSDDQRVSFFADDNDGAPVTPKADALFIPRENPRALFIRPIEQWPSKNSGEKRLFLNGKVSEEPSAPAYVEPSSGDRCGSPTANGHNEDDDDTSPVGPPPSELTPKVANGSHTDNTQKGVKDSSHITISGHRDGEEAIGYEYGADIMSLLPKLHHTDYYTEPRVQELAAKERANPGFCRRVKDFVVGRHGFGSIKFYGETDVRRLDLESIVEFNIREVIVYKDESKKPPVGQGLNKPAEVTLLNVRCMNRKTGQQYIEGPRVEKYKEMLAKKAEEQGAEFLSYDPVKGEWRFKVKHFSRYEFGKLAVDTDITEADLK